MRRLEYIPGQRVGSLTFVMHSYPHISPSRKSRAAIFECPCGKQFRSRIGQIKSGKTRSCGCFTGLTPYSERTATHHLTKHPVYVVWMAIKGRCGNPDRSDYPYYGGRGITISEEFRTNFKTFFDYVSELPKFADRERLKLTVDRIDNSGGYQRGNLRWATRKEQSANRRNTVHAS